jgi:hypothetical protein
VSEYGQHLRMYKHRFSGSIHDFYMRYNFTARLNYLRALTRWANVFGEENLIVRPFEPCQFENGTLVDDARAAFGLTDVALEIPQDLTINKGLSGPACVLLSHANRHELDAESHADWSISSTATRRCSRTPRSNSCRRATSST